jgi:hypothetical protein
MARSVLLAYWRRTIEEEAERASLPSGQSATSSRLTNTTFAFSSPTLAIIASISIRFVSPPVDLNVDEQAINYCCQGFLETVNWQALLTLHLAALKILAL